MVGLHMGDHHIIERSAAEQMLDIFKEQIAHSLVHGIHHGGFCIVNKIGIIGHTVRNGIHIFKQRKSAVTAADEINILRNLPDTIHGYSSIFHR